MTPSIADAVIIKDENLFFLSQSDGSLPVDEDHGFGLYYHDCRYLTGYRLTMGGEAPEPLVSTSVRGFKAVFELTNPDIPAGGWEMSSSKETVGHHMEAARSTASIKCCTTSSTFQNFNLEEITVPCVE